MDYQIFETRKSAKDAIAKMRGWAAKPERIYIPDAPGADKSGHVWVIKCASPVANGYLRSDGYIR